MGLAGGIVTGVINYKSFKNAFAELKIEKDHLFAQNVSLKSKAYSLTKLINESRENFEHILENVDGTKSQIEQASTDLTNIKNKDIILSNLLLRKYFLELGVKVDDAKEKIAAVSSNIEQQKILNSRIHSEIKADPLDGKTPES